MSSHIITHEGEALLDDRACVRADQGSFWPSLIRETLRSVSLAGQLLFLHQMFLLDAQWRDANSLGRIRGQLSCDSLSSSVVL